MARIVYAPLPRRRPFQVAQGRPVRIVQLVVPDTSMPPAPAVGERVWAELMRRVVACPEAGSSGRLIVSRSGRIVSHSRE